MLSELLPEEKRKLHDIEQKLIELERGHGKYSFSDLSFEWDELMTRLNELDKLVQKEPRTKIDDSRRRLNHLRTTSQHVKASLDNYGRKHNLYSASIQDQRRSLLGVAGSDQADMELELAENGSLTRSAQMVGEYIAIGRESLAELGSQRERLKAIQRRVLDMLNYLGLSNSLIKSIEDRENVDKWIVYGGMVLVLLIVFIVYMYLRK